VRMRHDSDGLVFHHASGAGKGYALCLECGRAAAMELGSREGRDPRFVHGHDRLRRGSKATNTSECSAGPESFKILRGIRLGGSEQTDVFELQLRTSADSAWLEDPLLAQSIAVALRGSVARILGVDEREIAWSVGPRTSDGRRSVLLSDAVSGGAGYVAEAIRSFEDIVRGAREILDCDEGCDRACHCCLLSHDTREMTEELDRLPALTFLEEFSEALEAENASLAGV
jgi:DEAD/DEAH box helicase domain-containing protein